MEAEFKKAKTVFEKAGSILLTMHEGMDGDDGGSVLAFQHFLESQGKRVASVIKHGVPEALSFLPGSEKILGDVPEGKFDLLATFGCAHKERTGLETVAKMEIPTINFDHHPDNTFFGHINLVDKDKSSVAELVYDFFVSSQWPISQKIATCLLTGIITDTGRFMHSNTHSSTFLAAASLMGKGARTTKISRQTSKHNNPRVLKAWAKAMENSRYNPQSKVISSAITAEDLAELGELPKSAFEGFIDKLNTVPEAKFAIFVRQDDQIIKGSIRSEAHKKVDVAKVARLFGGGGHKLAAGFSLKGKISKTEKDGWQIR